MGMRKYCIVTVKRNGLRYFVEGDKWATWEIKLGWDRLVLPGTAERYKRPKIGFLQRVERI